MHEGRIPAPPVDPGDANALVEKVHGGLVAHATAACDVVLFTEAQTRGRVDDDDLEWA